MKKTLHIIVGPTASGKTTFAIDLAKRLKTEIVSADSRQIFKEMSIGVARPSESELQSVKHHLIATWSIKENYSVARYEKEALGIINSLFEKYNDVVMVGGSGLYIDAIIKGIDYMPDISEGTRNYVKQLFSSQGITALQEKLKEHDPEYYNIVDKQNHRRLQRALEVCLESGKSFSSFRKESRKEREFDIKLIGIRRKREELVDRINKRVDNMINEGLVKEVTSLYEYKDLLALNTVGYKEIFEYLDNKTSLNEAIEQIKIHTRQYAKRQMTWFNKEENITWIEQPEADL
ncbi:MAG: tRNA (adenosine(37)-N6)-dimethylallyltransferase MiaA [Bacteroidota bacterium]|nr:tRNA (adenosine(37)-N6)-dimethylallyltransferase MiaA [Bacteroidota bacterium]